MEHFVSGRACGYKIEDGELVVDAYERSDVGWELRRKVVDVAMGDVVLVQATKTAEELGRWERWPWRIYHDLRATYRLPAGCTAQVGEKRIRLHRRLWWPVRVVAEAA